MSGGINGQSVDLNLIPISAIERIEILKDGASSIYGSDAIAGVVNIILKKHFDGMEVETFYGASSREDLRTQTASFSFGQSFEKSNLYFNTSYFDQGPIFSQNRLLSANADGRAQGGIDLRSSATPYARITLADPIPYILSTQGDGTPYPGTDPSHYRHVTQNDLYNYRELTHAFLPSQQKSLFITTDYEITPSLMGYLEMAYSKTTTLNQLAPTPLFTAFEDIDLTVSANNIYNPFNQDISDVRRRMLELGPRISTHRYDMRDFIIGFESQRTHGAWSLSYAQSISRSGEINTGMLNAQRVQRALGDSTNCRGLSIDGCEPLNLFGPPDSINDAQKHYILTETGAEGKNRLSSLSANFLRTIGYMPAGDIKIAAGIESRRETINQNPDTQRAAGIIIGGINLGASSGERMIHELYCELLLPVTQNENLNNRVELEISGRYSSYSDFGNSTNPKLGVRFYPHDGMLFRATYSEGFRAPTLYELFASEQQSFDQIADPCTYPASVDVLPGCSLLADSSRTQIQTVTGGNTSLIAEKAQSYTLGFVWAPEKNQGWNFSLDLYRIEQQNVVDSSAQFIVNQNAFLGTFRDLVIRDNNGNIVKIIATNLNIGIREILGADLNLTYAWTHTQYGKFAFAFNAAHINRFLDQIDPTAPRENLAGHFFDASSEGNGALPKWKSNIGLSWVRNDWDIYYSIHYISPLMETIPRISTMRRIGSWMIHDIQFSQFIPYSMNTRITVGIDNLFDQSPPFVASALNDNFDARTYDLTGRFFYLRLKKEF